MLRNTVIIIFILTSTVLARETGARYLIITHDDYYNDILPLAIWKHRKGLRTHIARLSQIGSTADSIRNYVVNAYSTWDIPPEYLLLVGAPNFLPMPTVGTTISDNYYTDIDGDLFNDILSGRLTVHSTTEAQTVVNKILLYERKPYLGDTLWFTNACLIANEDYGTYPPIGNDTVYWNDIRHAKNHMLANGYNTIDTMSAGLGNNAAHVVQAVNTGRGFVVYRGSGLNNWWSPFGVYPDQTANGEKLPIVLSMTCCTMGTGSTPATAEKWLLTGTPTTPRGAAGYFATTTVGGGFITFLRSRTCRGFFNALFAEHKRTFGECCEGGRKLAYETYGWASEYRGFTTLGDPEMNIWTDTPCSLVVIHPQAIGVGTANFTVNVARVPSSVPVNGAVVCVTARSDTMVYALDSTDATGTAHFNINPQIVADTIYVTVTGKNLKPYEGSMVTFASGGYVIYLKSSIDDAAGGNNDTMINPGEHINMPLWVRNYGDSTAYSVVGTLRSADTLIAITDSVKVFGSVNPGDSAFTGSDGYDFDVMPYAPDQHVITFELLCQDIDDSIWISYFNKVVHSAHLVFLSTTIGGGNGNGYFEPGETVTVAVTIRNEGTAAIDTVMANLRCSSPYVGIIDSTSSFTPIPPQTNATNSTDPFTVFSSTGTPAGTTVGFEIIVSSGSYLDTLEFALCIGGKHYFIWNPDATPGPGQNMHSILSGLGYIGDYDTLLIPNLALYQSVWVCLGVWPNNQTITVGSPEAATLVDYIQNGGRMYMEGGDVWYFDPLSANGYDFTSLFGISATDDGTSDMGPVNGQYNTFTTGMNFAYAGENSYMDHISPANANAFLVFRDGDDYYDCGVAHNVGSYRTIGTSFELGLLTDASPPSMRSVLLDSIMRFFGIATGIEEIMQLDIKELSLHVAPNPFSTLTTVSFSIAQSAESIELRIYDAAGRLIKQLYSAMYHAPCAMQVVWDGRDDRNRRVSSGVYFVRLAANETRQTTKVILLR